MTESTRIYTAMKQDIVTCELTPGASVSEAELCGRYEAGRTPLRETCRRLQEESLIQIIPFRGYFIAPLTLAEYRNLHEAQLIVEPAVAALAAERATQEQIKRIETLAEYEYYPGMKTSYCAFLERNYDFHLEIAAAGGNRVFQDMAANMQVRLMRYFYQVISLDSFGRILVNEHREIARAIRRRDPELARQKAAEHLEKTIERSARLNLSSSGLVIEDANAGTNDHKLREPAAAAGGRRRF